MKKVTRKRARSAHFKTIVRTPYDSLLHSTAKWNFRRAGCYSFGEGCIGKSYLDTALTVCKILRDVMRICELEVEESVSIFPWIRSSAKAQLPGDLDESGGVDRSRCDFALSARKPCEVT